MNSTETAYYWQIYEQTLEYERYLQGQVSKLYSTKTATTVVNFYLTPLVAVVGVFVNVLSIAVLSRDDTMAETTSLLLRMLATSDLLNIIFTTSFTSLSHIGAHIFVDIVKPWFDKVSLPVQSIAFTATVWTEVLLTAERYVAVCFPLHVGRVVTLSRVRGSVICVWIFAVLLNICRGFEWFVAAHPAGGPNNTYWTWTETRRFATGSGYHIAYTLTVFPIFTLFLPVALLAFFTVQILRYLNKSYREQLTLTSVNQQKQTEKAKAMASKQRRTTATLISVIVIFLLSQISTFAHYVYSLKVNDKFSLSVASYTKILVADTTDDFLQSFAFCFVVLKSTLNFFIFCITGQKYRQLLRVTFGCAK